MLWHPLFIIDGLLVLEMMMAVLFSSVLLFGEPNKLCDRRSKRVNVAVDDDEDDDDYEDDQQYTTLCSVLWVFNAG